MEKLLFKNKILLEKLMKTALKKHFYFSIESKYFLVEHFRKILKFSMNVIINCNISFSNIKNKTRKKQEIKEKPKEFC